MEATHYIGVYLVLVVDDKLVEALVIDASKDTIYLWITKDEYNPVNKMSVEEFETQYLNQLLIRYIFEEGKLIMVVVNNPNDTKHKRINLTDDLLSCEFSEIDDMIVGITGDIFSKEFKSKEDTISFSKFKTEVFNYNKERYVG